MKDGAVLIFGMRGNVFRSSDDGANWVRVPIDVKSAINGGTVTADGRVILAGNSGLIAQSLDGGKTFTSRKVAGGQDLGQARFSSDGAIIYIGNRAAGRTAVAVEGKQ